MSTAPWATAILSGPCSYCGGYHTGLCPRIKSIEYHSWGGVKRIEFHDGTPAWPEEKREVRDV